MSGMGWTTLGGIAALAVQVPYSAVMSRLLSPADFGLLAVAALLLRGVSHFTLGGLPSAVVQRPQLGARTVRATFTLGSGAGLVAYALFWMAAPYGTRLLNASPELTAVSRSLALTLIIDGLGSTAAGLLRRSMRYRAVATIEFASHLLGYCGIGLVSALLGNGVWSLVHAALGQAVVSLLATYALVRHPLRPLCDLAAMRETGSYGAQITLVGFLELLDGEFANVLIGRYAGVVAAGHYNRAMLVTQLPLEQLSTSISKVLNPAYSRIQSEVERLAAALRSSIALSALVSFPLAAVFAALGDNLIAVLLGSQWHTAAGLVPPLAATAALSCVVHLIASLAEAIGDARRKIWIKLAQLLTMTVAAFVAVAGGTGVLGLVTALLVSRVTEAVLYFGWVARRFPGSRRTVLVACGQALGVAALTWSVLAGVGALLSGEVPALAALTAQVLVAVLLTVAVARHGEQWLMGVRTIREHRLVSLARHRRIPETS